MSSLIQINDRFTYERFITMAGYPSMIVRNIPREEDDHNSSNSNSDNDSDNNDEEKKEKTKKNVKQKWPLFGERLINGNINKEIYEYIITNHKVSHRCLFAILFPSEYKLNKEDGIDDDNDKVIKIPEDKRKEILLSMLKSIFGERNNYPLFKYLYLTPARSLLYKIYIQK